MSSGAPKSSCTPEKDWQQAYKTALFETDKSRVAERIADAARVIRARARSLFNDPQIALAERNALDAALYALSVLQLYTRTPKNASNEAAIPRIQQSA